jgi:ATP-dependent DNA ligase
MHWHNPGRPPGFIEPCLPTPARIVPTGAQWVYEIKHDGFRFICRRDDDRVRVFSRRGIDRTSTTASASFAAGAVIACACSPGEAAPAIAEALMTLRSGPSRPMAKVWSASLMV